MKIILYLNLQIFVTYTCIFNFDHYNQAETYQFFWKDQIVHGVYTRYAPMMPHHQVQGIFNEDYNSSFLFKMKFQNDYSILAYATFSFSNLQIQHIVQLQNHKNEIIQKEIIEMDYLNYEGNLVATQLQLNQNQSQLILSVEINQFKTVKFFENITFLPSNFLFQAGGGLNESFLTYLPGISHYLKGCFGFWEYDIFSQYNFLFCQGQDPDINHEKYQKDKPLLLSSDKLVYLNYSINFWNKIGKSSKFINNGTIQIISINQIQPKQGTINFGTDTLRIEIDIMDVETSTIQLYYYSYSFPLLNLNQELIRSSIHQQAISNIQNDLLTEWHHIQILMQSKILILNFFFPKFDQSIHFQSEKIYQFSLSPFQILIGQSNLQDFTGEIQQYSFNPCYSDGRIFYKCHISCLKCFGPFSDNCISCNLNSFREFNSIKNTCQCKPFYLEINEQNCLQIPDYYQASYNNRSNQIGYEQLEPDIICAYGYFLYEDNCYQCPSVVDCQECYEAWNTWVFNPICKSNQMDPDIYVFHDLELIYCNGCSQICNKDNFDHYCQRHPYDHMNQPFYVKYCLYRFLNCHVYQYQTLRYSYQVNYLSQEYCTDILDGECYQCKFSNQFLQYDRIHCQECLIKNCKYCFQYRSVGQYVSTLELRDMQSPISESWIDFSDDYQIGCALCEDGYFYNQALNECLKVSDLIFDCLKYFVDINENIICLQTELNDFSKGIESLNCDFIISNCYSCMRMSVSRIICTQCQQSYYLTSQLTCSLCPKNAQECHYDTEFLSQKWIFQIQPFYVYQYNFTQNFNFNWDLDDQFLQVNCLDGYLFVENQFQCISYVKPQNCLQNFQQFCTQCTKSDDYQYEFCNYYGNCIQCPYQCNMCSSNLQYCLLTDFSKYYISQITRMVYPILNTVYRYKLQFSVDTYTDKLNLLYFQLYQPQEIIVNIKLLTQQEINIFPLFFKDYKVFNQFKSLEVKQLNLFFNDQLDFTGFIYNFDIVNFYNVNINIFYKDNPLIVQNENQNGLTLQFQNLTISRNSSLNMFQNPIIIKNCKKLLIQNCLISNITTQNQVIFDISVEEDSIINLSNITFYNNNLINVTIFSLVHQKIKIFNITFLNCTFQNFSLFKITDSTSPKNQFEILIITIIQSEFKNFTILSENQYKEIKIENFTISNSKIEESQFISSFSNLILSDLKFLNNTFQQFSIAYGNSSYENSLVFLNFQSFQDQIVNSLLFQIYLQIEIIQFRNIFFSETNITNTIFQIQSDLIEIENYVAERFSGFHFLIQKSLTVKIRNINLKESFFEKFQFQPNLENQIYENYFMIIQSFLSLNIDDCLFDKIYTKENSILKINSELEGVVINIQNISFSNCFLLQTTNIPKVSLLEIQTSIFSQIQIQNSKCITTLVITKKFDQFGSQASLLSIIAQQGYIFIFNVILLDNYISKSTLGMIYLEAQKINVTKVSNKNSNIYVNQDFLFDGFITKLKENQIFSQLYEINSFGGVFNIQSESLLMQYVESYNSTAATGGFSYIQLNLQCNSKIQYIKLINTQAIDQRSIGGSFYIECSSNNLNLEISYADIVNSTSVLNGGFLYLVPSPIKNTLQISHIKCKGINSIASSFLDIKFEKSSNMHKVIIQNVYYKFSFSDFQLFSQFNKKISLQDMKLFNENNGLIVIQNGIVTLDNLQFFGDVISQPIYYLVSNQKLSIWNNQIFFIKQLAEYCVYFQSADGQSNFFFYNFLIKQLNYKYNYTLSQISQQNETLFQQFIENLKPISSLMQFYSSNYFQKLKIIDLQIFYINQGVYETSLVNIIIQNQHSIKIEKAILIQNNCGQEACISIKNYNTSIQGTNIIKNSYIISNQHQNYGTYNLVQVNFWIRESIFLHNRAELQGGAIYYEQYNFSRIENSIFINNSANEGGAIFSKELMQNSIQNNLFMQNFAKFMMKNYGQSYYQLKLIENQLKQKNNKSKEEESNRSSDTIILNLPSGQALKDYEIFNKSQQNFIKLNYYKFYLIVLNKFHEQQTLNDSFQCQIFEQLVNKQFQLISNQSNQRIVQANSTNNAFNLNEVVFTKDPYTETFLQINVECDFVQLSNNTYIFYINTYECQIGEYFYQDQCLQCNSEQGFYNLAPKTADCKKINTNIIKSNKNSLLELYPEYWRSSIFSDDISYCRNNPNNCIGGIVVGNDLCKIAHIGALCEECDLYDIRGAGQFSKNSNYTCSLCGSGAIIKFIFISIWILFQINLAVKSTQQQNKTYLLYKIQTKFYLMLFRQQQDQSSSIFKLILNYFQIIQIIQTFQINFSFSLEGVFNFIGNSSYNVSYDFDCYLSRQSEISIIYLNLIWMIHSPIAYYLMFIFIKLFLKNLDLGIFSKETIYSSHQYLIVSLKANIVSQLINLMIPRKISGISWISRNVSYLYFNENHILIVLYELIPLLLLLSLAIPLIYFILLEQNQNRLTSYVFKQKYGYIYNEYKNENYFWELIKLLKRELIIVILVIFQDSLVLKGIFLLLVLQIYYIIFLKNNPYYLKRLNQFEHKFIIFTNFVFLLSLSFYQYEIESSSFVSLSFIIKIIIQSLLLILILQSFYQIFWIVKSYHHKSIEKIIGKFERGVQYLEERRKKSQRNSEILEQLRKLMKNGCLCRIKGKTYEETTTQAKVSNISKILKSEDIF